jgi:acyl carrier protein
LLSYIKKNLIEYVDVAEENITAQTRFVADLNLNSYDFISIVGKVETELDIEIPDAEIRDIQTVGEMAEYLKKKIK